MLAPSLAGAQVGQGGGYSRLSTVCWPCDHGEGVPEAGALELGVKVELFLTFSL